MSSRPICEKTSVDSSVWKVPQIDPKVFRKISNFWHLWWNYVQKYNNQGPLKFLKLAIDLVSSLNHFLSAKNNPNKYSWDWKPLFSQQDFQNAIFLIFFSVKSYEGGTRFSFSSQTTFLMPKSAMKSRGYALTKFREEARSRKKLKWCIFNSQ